MWWRQSTSGCPPNYNKKRVLRVVLLTIIISKPVEKKTPNITTLHLMFHRKFSKCDTTLRTLCPTLGHFPSYIYVTNTQLPEFGTCRFWSQSSPTVSFWKNKHKPEPTNLTLPTACFLSKKNTQKRNIWILLFRSTSHSSRYSHSDIPTTQLSNSECRDDASTCLGF